MGSVACAKLRSHLHIAANGERQLCCNAVYKPGGFTDEEVRLLAERADAGIGNKWCVRCYQTEAMGVSSARNDANARQLSRGDEIQWIDIRFSNLCNLACKMCSSLNSSTIARQEGNPGVVRNTFSLDEGHAKTVKIAYLAGGEPMLEKRNVDLLRSLLPSCAVEVNTNCTAINPLITKELERFGDLTFYVSIEAYGELNSQIRKGSSWSTICTNLKLLQAQFPNARFFIATVLQHDNVNRLDELAAWISQNPRLRWVIQPQIAARESALKTSDIDKRKLKVALSLAGWQITAFSRQYIQALLENKVLFANIDHGQA